jgi:hypothetical protein
MAEVFKSQEVYKHVNYDLHDRNEMIAVRGVYVTGEYRPPYYNEPILGISYIRGVKPTIDNFETEETETTDPQTTGMYNFSVSVSAYNLERYSSESVDATNAQTTGMYNFGISSSVYNIDRYEKDYTDTTDPQTTGMYNLGVPTSQYRTIICQHIHENSTPEYGIGLSFLRTDSAIIENYIP